MSGLERRHELFVSGSAVGSPGVEPQWIPLRCRPFAVVEFIWALLALRDPTGVSALVTTTDSNKQVVQRLVAEAINGDTSTHLGTCVRPS